MRLMILALGLVFIALAGCATTGEMAGVSATENLNQTPTMPEEPTIPETPATMTPEPTIPEGDEGITLTDIAQHATQNDCWTAIHGKVYDITEFVTSHPGGPPILGACGIDGTELFTTRNGNGPHPSGAQNTLDKYYIGDLS